MSKSLAFQAFSSTFLLFVVTGFAEELPPPADVARQFDAVLRAELKLAPADLAPPADDAVALRRLWFDTVGYPPPTDDVTSAFAGVKNVDRAATVRLLLDHPDFSENWGRYWVEALRERSQTKRVPQWDLKFVGLLRTKIAERSPWSEIATEVITTDSRTYFFSDDQMNPGFAASEASRIFLGISIECAECHDHPFASWKQRHYREFAAFFDQALVFPDTPRKRLEEAPEKSLVDVTPRFFLDDFSVEIAAEDRIRRKALAARMVSTENKWFARAFVNRICGELLGQGFYDLPDDIGPDRPCLAPTTLDLLADDFAASDYDIRRLFEIVLSTETYGLQARSHGDESFRPFACNRIQPLRSDQFVATLLRTLGRNLPPDFDERTFDDEGRQWGPTPREQVREVFGFGPSQDRGDVRRGVRQAMALINSEMVERAILDPQQSGGPASLIARTQDNDELARALYVHVLGRYPNERERLLAVEALFSSPTRETAFVDLTWALLNSAEFSHRP
jgi:hypothetical protein